MDPQNPYYSAMIEASAGSGKTYQLSKRFLFLVGAGSDPASILTITFTNKAALEMRERIIQEAYKLLYCSKTAKIFDDKLLCFYANKQKETEVVLKKPFLAKQTAKFILSSTQSLKVSTIDSVFYEWMMRFPLLSSNAEMFSEAYQILTDSTSIKKVNKDSWNKIFFEDKSEIVGVLSAIKAIKYCDNIFDVKLRVEEIFRHVTFVDYLTQQNKNVIFKCPIFIFGISL